MAAVLVSGCSEGYQRGDCDPGYLDVNGTCTLAVGQECSSGSNCLSRICLSNPEGGMFCSIGCQLHDDCPTGFFCTTWDDHRCYPGQRPPPCQAEADCDACETCMDGVCTVEDGCQLCQADEDCGACKRCDVGECIAVAGCQSCLNNSACPTCEICSASGRCERLPGCILCAIDADCPGCSNCDRNACVPIDGCGLDPCFNDLDCPQRTRCLVDATQGYSVCLPTGLPFGADCLRGGDPTCLEGICLFDPSGPSASCSRPCAMDDDCPDGSGCKPDQDCLWACRAPSTPPPAGACLHDADCAQDRVCGLVPDPNLPVWQSRCVAPEKCAGAAGGACGENTTGRCVSGICSPSQLCTPVCAGDADCPSEFLCVVLDLTIPDGDPAPFWGCAPMEEALFEIGQACPAGDNSCRSGLCLQPGINGPRARCTSDCTPGAAQCPDRFVCQPDPQQPQVNRCQAAVSGGACNADAVCEAFQVCRIDPADGQLKCEPAPPGTSPSGAVCRLDGECAHGACLPEGVCAAPCRDAADCPVGSWCDIRDWTRADGSRSWLALCSPDPGSLGPCRHAADCPDGEVCRPELNLRGTGLAGRCGPPGTGAEHGAACLSQAGCETGLCIPTGSCSSMCELDNDCPPGSFCGSANMPLGDQFYGTGACLPDPVGLGEPCPNGPDDCLSGLCHLPVEGEAYCTQACARVEDCIAVAGMTCISDAQGTTCRHP